MWLLVSLAIPRMNKFIQHFFANEQLLYAHPLQQTAYMHTYHM